MCLFVVYMLQISIGSNFVHTNHTFLGFLPDISFHLVRTTFLAIAIQQGKWIDGKISLKKHMLE